MNPFRRTRRWLELFCCLGGTSAGYSRAGFAVYGVDLFADYSQKSYPFPSWRGDVFDAIARLVAGELLPFTAPDGSVEWLGLEDFDAIGASPPCQRYSITNAARKADYPDLIGRTREALQAIGLPYVIENVVGAPLVDAVELCGCMFGLEADDADGQPLRMERARLFESSVALEQPSHDHTSPAQRARWVAGCYGGARKAKRRPGETLAEVAPRDRHEARYVRKGGYVPRSKAVVQTLMGIDWPMSWKGLHQAIPPAYTEWIGRQVAQTLDREPEAVA